MRLRNRAEPVMFVRSPTLTKSESVVMLTGSSPDSRVAGSTIGGVRGVHSATAAATADTCSGVVPQHPPTRFTRPLVANSPTMDEVSSADSSYSPKALGSPALGYAETKQFATRDSSARYGRISLAPSAQLRPTANGRAWRTEFQNASVTCPERVRPDASVIVPDTMTGRRWPTSSKRVS